jgi:hypothetical protein
MKTQSAWMGSRGLAMSGNVNERSLPVGCQSAGATPSGT